MCLKIKFKHIKILLLKDFLYINMFKLNHSNIYDILQHAYSTPSIYFGRGKSFFMPLVYTLSLTYKCNLSCFGCYRKNNGLVNNNINELKTQDWLDLIDQIQKNAVITLLGGEALLRKDFLQIFEKASKKRMTTIITNGTLLTEKTSEFLINNNLTMLSVSLDGIGETHNKIRGASSETFNKILHNIEIFNKLRKNKKTLLEIKTLITEDNIDELFDLYKLAEKLDANYITYTFKKSGELQQNSFLKDDLGSEFFKEIEDKKPYFDINKLTETIIKIQTHSKKSKTFVRFYPTFKNVNKIRTLYRKLDYMPLNNICYQCLFPWLRVQISPDGYLFPCLSYKIGNIKDQKLKDIWNNEKFIKFRKIIKENKVLPSCQMCCHLRIKD